MPEHVFLKIGGRTVLLLPNACVEQWTDDSARWRLREIAADWPGREALLRLSAETLGPDEDVDAAIEHLARDLDRGWLLALRMPDDRPAADGARSDAQWDAPRLAELRVGDDTRRSEAPRTRAPADVSLPRGAPSVPSGPPGDRPTDTWSTFVAFVIVDQHGKPLAGESRCTIDGTQHVHALGDAPIEIEPIRAHARVLLELAELETGATS